MAQSVAQLKKYRSRFGWVFAISFVVLLVSNLFLFALPLCGLRVSEVAALRLGELDLESGLLRVTEGKGLKDRLVPVMPWLRGQLAAYLQRARPHLVSLTSALSETECCHFDHLRPC